MNKTTPSASSDLLNLQFPQLLKFHLPNTRYSAGPNIFLGKTYALLWRRAHTCSL